MHGFHTYEIDHFVYPALCSRCAKCQPTQTWRLVHSTIEFPNGMPTGLGNEKRDYVDYVTQVPVCDGCHAALKRGSRLCWMLGAIGGAVTGCAVIKYMVPLGIKLEGCMLSALGGGVVVTIALGWVFKMIATDGFGFAKFNAHQNTIKFRNRDYQKLFDEKNPKPYQTPTGAGMSRAY